MSTSGSEVLIIPERWKDAWGCTDCFEQIFSLQGDEYRNMDGRRTLRFDMLGQSYFVKMYQGIGWWRVCKSLLTFRLPPVFSAYNEWLAIKILTELGVDTMTTVAYGERGRNPIARQSFLVTQDLQPTESLEDFCSTWAVHPPAVAVKRALLTRVAEVTRLLHSHGINHRDYYLCHFLLDITSGREHITSENLRIHLIDLHRVQFRKRVPLRWRIKDLASLYFSAQDIGLTRRDRLRFIRIYMGLHPGESVRGTLKQDRGLWRQVERRCTKLYVRYQRKYRDNDA
ncbi:MAG: lipopolysaccharide core heptose(I) kinase RfaP [Desulfuromonadaceae bacterium]|nr:lipopolysaccharide core heptose(I) kinase RfaP [Desulfuromonadaceae bacterium]